MAASEVYPPDARTLPLPTSNHQDTSVRKCCRCVRLAADVEIASRSPSPRGRVIYLNAVKLVAIPSSNDQDLAIRQQRRCVALARRIEVASASPRPGGRVVQLRSVEGAGSLLAAND